MEHPERRTASETTQPAATDLDRRTALKKIGALAGAAPAVSLLLTPSAARARGWGGSPCEDDRHRNCHGNGHGGDRPGQGHGWGHGPDKPGNGWGNGWGHGRDRNAHGWPRGGKNGHGNKPGGRDL